MHSWSEFFAAYDDRLAAARAWKARGGRVAGWMGPAAPVELIAAAGYMPLQLAGQPGEPTPLADRWMEDLFDPAVRSVFQRLLAGDYDLLDLIVLPRTSDSVQRLYYYLCELRRVGAARLPETLMFDLAHTPWETSERHNLRRAVELRSELERISGAPIAEAALAAEIAAANRRRRGLRSLLAARRQSPPLSGEAALLAIDAWRTLDGEAFDRALQGAIAAPGSQDPAGPRLLLAGSAQDHPGLHRLIARLGASVVGDAHALGEPSIGPDIAEDGPPLPSLVAHYHHGVVSPRTFPSRPEAMVEAARAAGADGVLFYFFAEEEALTWELPGQKRALAAAGLASLGLTMQPYAIDEAAVTGALTPFLAQLNGGARA